MVSKENVQKLLYELENYISYRERTQDVGFSGNAIELVYLKALREQVESEMEGEV